MVALFFLADIYVRIGCVWLWSALFYDKDGISSQIKFSLNKLNLSGVT